MPSRPDSFVACPADPHPRGSHRVHHAARCMDVVTRRPTLTLWQVLEREGWRTRAAAVIVVIGAGLNLARIILWPLDLNWGPDDLAGSLVALAFAWSWFGWVYWRRRAIEAEKPLPPTMVVHEYPSVGSAAMAHMVEDIQRRERAQSTSFMGRR